MILKRRHSCYIIMLIIANTHSHYHSMENKASVHEYVVLISKRTIIIILLSIIISPNKVLPY